MPRTATHRAPGRPRRSASPITDARYQRRLEKVLGHATEVFCEHGYEGASMRDLSRASGMSLAGLYHYFGSKERLLYLIQKETFTTIVSNLKARLEMTSDPESRIRSFIENHLEYFIHNQQGMKVLSHEDEVLKNGMGLEIRALKREYYRICLGLMDSLQQERGLQFDSRTAVMSLFGMMNWIYTWYNPRVDGDAAQLAQRMGDIFLQGVMKDFSGRAARHRNGIGKKTKLSAGM
jgi:TetR/AcrR family transcriptional regulator, cholesterol catabolism regulator